MLPKCTPYKQNLFTKKMYGAPAINRIRVNSYRLQLWLVWQCYLSTLFYSSKSQTRAPKMSYKILQRSTKTISMMNLYLKNTQYIFGLSIMTACNQVALAVTTCKQDRKGIYKKKHIKMLSYLIIDHYDSEQGKRTAQTAWFDTLKSIKIHKKLDKTYNLVFWLIHYKIKLGIWNQNFFNIFLIKYKNKLICD